MTKFFTAGKIWAVLTARAKPKGSWFWGELFEFVPFRCEYATVYIL